MDNQQVADVLSEIGVLLELKGENPFKTRAYASAARTIETLPDSIESYVKENRLGTLKGFGEALQQKITELVTRGSLAYHQDLKASLPPGLLEMLELQGLGPKKVKALYDSLAIDSIEKLETACKDGKVAEIKGFGEKTQTKILDSIAFKRQFASKHRLDAALFLAEPILASLRGHPDVIRCSLAGSARRYREIVGDLDFIVSSRHPDRVIEFFASQPGILQVLAKGETKCSVTLEEGMQADLRVVNDGEYPFALAY
ncbi:MAG: histidinol-phosphatase, partial [Verrucomicrobia bacterium]|nr:histidinol-phosphatase [Verrucomicrobiota bacterium]